MRLLGYQPTRPRLRVLSLPEEVIDPSPVPLNGAMCALDRAVVRDGWIVFMPNEEVWGVPTSFTGKAFRVGRWWDCVPGLNSRTVWLGGRVARDPSVGRDPDAPNLLEEYDGVRRETVRTLEIPPGFALSAVTPEALVLGDRDGRLWVMSWDLSDSEVIGEGRVFAQHRSRIAIQTRTGDLRILHLSTGSQIAIRRALPGQWGMFGSFSPDGKTLALDVSERATGPQDAAGVFEPKWTRLVLVAVDDGEVRLVEGHFDNFATAPVWTADGSWLIFEAPFDKSMFACCLADAEPTLEPIVRRRGRPVPLVDVTDLLPAGSPTTVS
jgi:hypothetical protein